MHLEASNYSLYQAFGLRFRSQLAQLPVPKVSDDKPEYDVEIVLEAVPDQLDAPVSQGTYFEAQPGQFLFKTQMTANFWVQEGHKISIALKPDVNVIKLHNFLLGSVTGGLLIQRGILALHGCTIATPSGAVVVCGHSGAGKSTLTGLMLERGFKILDDNIAALYWNGDQYQVQPGSGFVRLTTETLNLLNLSPPELSFSTPTALKYMHFLPSSGFCDRPQPLRQIWVLDRSQEAWVTSVSKRDKLSTLQQFTYMTHVVNGLGQMQNYFQQWVKLANTIPIDVIGHPPNAHTQSWADQIAQLLLASTP